jgi:hypothetical protein
LFRVTAFVEAVGFIAGKEKERDIDESTKKDNSGIEIRILEDGFWCGGERVHTVKLPN